MGGAGRLSPSTARGGQDTVLTEGDHDLEEARETEESNTEDEDSSKEDSSKEKN